MLIELRPSVNIGSLDGVEEELGHTHTFNVDQMWLEEDLRCFESLSTELYYTTIWKLEKEKAILNGVPHLKCTFKQDRSISWGDLCIHMSSWDSKQCLEVYTAQGHKNVTT